MSTLPVTNHGSSLAVENGAFPLGYWSWLQPYVTPPALTYPYTANAAQASTAGTIQGSNVPTGSNSVFIDGYWYAITPENQGDLYLKRVAQYERERGRKLTFDEKAAIAEALRIAANAYATGQSPLNPNENLGKKEMEQLDNSWLVQISNTVTDGFSDAKNFVVNEGPGFLKNLSNTAQLAAIAAAAVGAYFIFKR